MSSTVTGISQKIGVYEDTTTAGLGGKIVSSSGPEKRVLNSTESPNTGTRQVDINTTGIYWAIPFSMKIQNLSDFIIGKCFVSNEGALGSFNQYYEDSVTKIGFANALVDTCKISIDQQNFLVADVTPLALTPEPKNFTIPVLNYKPMTKKAISLTIDDVLVPAFETIDFSVNNHVTAASSGNGDAATDLFAKEATYEINVKLFKKAALQFGEDSTTKQKTIVLTITDNQSPTPVAKTFTWANAELSSNSNSLEGLGIVYENIKAKAKNLVIS
jgi:hypothetical protein